jgi:hypothetical protein
MAHSALLTRAPKTEGQRKSPVGQNGKKHQYNLSQGKVSILEKEPEIFQIAV